MHEELGYRVPYAYSLKRMLTYAETLKRMLTQPCGVGFCGYAPTGVRQAYAGRLRARSLYPSASNPFAAASFSLSLSLSLSLTPLPLSSWLYSKLWPLLLNSSLLNYSDGLARFCTQPYAAPTSKNMDQVYMHLTNYSLNKFSKGFVKNLDDNEDVASKR